VRNGVAYHQNLHCLKCSLVTAEVLQDIVAKIQAVHMLKLYDIILSNNSEAYDSKSLTLPRR